MSVCVCAKAINDLICVARAACGQENRQRQGGDTDDNDMGMPFLSLRRAHDQPANLFYRYHPSTHTHTRMNFVSLPWRSRDVRQRVCVCVCVSELIRKTFAMAPFLTWLAIDQKDITRSNPNAFQHTDRPRYRCSKYFETARPYAVQLLQQIRTQPCEENG